MRLTVFSRAPQIGEQAANFLLHRTRQQNEEHWATNTQLAMALHHCTAEPCCLLRRQLVFHRQALHVSSSVAAQHGAMDACKVWIDLIVHHLATTLFGARSGSIREVRAGRYVPPEQHWRAGMCGQQLGLQLRRERPRAEAQEG